MTSDTIAKFKDRFDSNAAKGMSEVFQFHFSDAGDFVVKVEDGSLDIHEGEHDAPSVSLTTDVDTLKGIMNGDINGMSAFMSGKLKATGNVMLATRLTSLFPSG